MDTTNTATETAADYIARVLAANGFAAPAPDAARDTYIARTFGLAAGLRAITERCERYGDEADMTGIENAIARQGRFADSDRGQG